MSERTGQTGAINFLNGITERFPSAVSFAAGAPAARLLNRLDPVKLLASSTGISLLQYGRTDGLIHESIAQQLRNDRAIAADHNRLLITSGCQEAIQICMAALCPSASDVMLVCNPTYPGATGAAQSARVAVAPVAHHPEGLAAAIDKTAAHLAAQGRAARGIYLIPTFDNPTGATLSEAERLDVLEVCAKQRMVVLEDDTYGMFRYEGHGVPPMAAMDSLGCVIYLSSYSKTVAPGLRMGLAHLPETLFGDRRLSQSLFQDLLQRKSVATLNTSPISQAILHQFLVEQNFSLRDWVEPVRQQYRENRNELLKQIETNLMPISPQIGYRRPEGGFFLSLRLPFPFDKDSVTECASAFHVIVTPMSFFALDNSQDCAVRFAFSSVDARSMESAIVSFSRYVAQRLQRGTAARGGRRPAVSLPFVDIHR